MTPPATETRTDLVAMLQRPVLEALAATHHLPDLPQLLTELRSHYRELLDALTDGDRPRFSTSMVRLAYALAVHPAEVTACARAYSNAGTAMLGLTGEQARVTIVGATSGAALIGLARYLTVDAPQLTGLEITFVDDRDSWETTRATTVGRTLPSVWPGTSSHATIVIDPSSTRAEQQLAPALASTDLLVVDARWARAPIATATGTTTLLARLMDRFAGTTRLVVLEPGTHGHRPAQRSPTVDTSGRDDLVTLLDSSITAPVSDPLEVVATHLHGSDIRTSPPRAAHTSIRVHVRPPAASTAAAPASFELTGSQRTAMERFAAFLESPERIFILRGAAGTGKTSLVTDMLAFATYHELPTELLTPTGRAARRLEELAGRAASTIHSAIYTYEGHELHPDRPESPPTARFRRTQVPNDAGLTLVDEASMIGDAPDLDQRETEVRFGEGKLLSDLLDHALCVPGSKLVFIGDPWQLPPVGEHHSPALDPELLSAYGYGEPVVADLEEVVRQKQGSAVLGFATEIRDAAQQPDAPVPLYRPDPSAGLGTISRTDLPAWTIDAIARGDAAVVATRNRDVGVWNTLIRNRLGRPSSAPTLDDRLLMIRGNRVLDNGDEVTVVATAPDVEVVQLRDEHVTLREVTLCHEDRILGPVITSGMLVEDLLVTAPSGAQLNITQVLFVDLLMRTGLRHDDPDLPWYLAGDERYNAMRATYAYARTCHRAQGSEWRDVVLDGSGIAAFTTSRHRLLYTAVTRARTALWATGLKVARSRYDDGRLLEELRDQLTPLGITVTSTAAVQHGLQAHLSDGRDPARIVLYRRDGRPSSVQPEGPHRPGYLDDVLATVDRWIDDLGFDEQPVNAEVAVTVDRLAEHLASAGYDLRTTSPAAYQVTLDISDGDRHHRVTRHHNADGLITTAAGPVPGEHPDLAARLDAAIAACQPVRPT